MPNSHTYLLNGPDLCRKVAVALPMLETLPMRAKPQLLRCPTAVLCRFLAMMLLLCRGATAAVLYVDVNSSNPTSPYTNWATAASVIQDAVDVSTNGDTVLVTNVMVSTKSSAVPDHSRDPAVSLVM